LNLATPVLDQAVVTPDDRPMIDRELARKNLVFGLALFGLFLALFAGTIVVALIYLAVD